LPQHAYVGLGSNLQNPVNQVRCALVELAAISGTTLISASSLYTSSPMGPAGQPDYINAVAHLRTTLNAESLLHELQGIERVHQRVRSTQQWGPRTLDLDLLLYAELVLNTQELTIPHRGLHERSFVLVPLLEIAPELEVPGRGTVRDLAAQCSDHDIERIAS